MSTSVLQPERSWKRGFWCLFITQFQGAFSDNLYRFLVIFHLTTVLEPAARDRLIPVVMALFALPFILFAMAGGHLADRYSKRSVAIATKFFEIFVMSLGTLALASGYIPFLLAIIFLMSVQSAFFGPSKYGLLPELLPEKRLSWGNGILNLGTFLAIISGGIAAGFLSDRFSERPLWPGLILVGLAIAGTAASTGISRLPAANPKKRYRINFLAEIFAQFRYIRQDRLLFLAVLGGAWFWFLGGVLDPNILIFGKEILGLERDLDVTSLRAALAIGIGLGSFAAGYFSGPKIEYGLVPLGAIGLTVALAALGIPAPGFAGTLAFLALCGFFAGFYIVPLSALIQHRPDPSRKGSVIATEGWLAFVGVFIAAAFYFVLTSLLGLDAAGVFLALAAMTFSGGIVMFAVLPEAFLRLALWLFTHSVCRLRIEGRDNIPDKGGALLVCNRVSLGDALLLIASTDRQIRFVMDRRLYDHPRVRRIARSLEAIPLSPEQRPRELVRALAAATEAIRQGHVVCMLAGERTTSNGTTLPFSRGIARIMRGVDAPVVTVTLEGLSESILRFDLGRFHWKLPRRLLYKVTARYDRFASDANRIANSQ